MAPPFETPRAGPAGSVAIWDIGPIAENGVGGGGSGGV